MDDFQGKVAVVTGGASGIGRGMAESLLAAGAKVVLADVEAPRLEETRTALSSLGDVIAKTTDVSKFEQVQALGDLADSHFGGVHILCNNAGIGVGNGPTWESTLDDWAWILGVNLMGVVHGVKAFVPRMVARGEEGAVVNTASMAGLVANSGNALYGVTKHGVVAMTEALHAEFRRWAPHLQAHVVCPGFISTRILDSERNRPAELGDTQTPPKRTPLEESFGEVFSAMVENGMPPRELGDLVVQALRTNRFYVLSHPWENMVESRMRAILDGKAPGAIAPPDLLEKFQEHTKNSSEA